MDYEIKKDKQILVIGDLMIDHYIYGICNRISPEAPVQVVEVKNDIYTLGGAGNVLQNLIALSCQANIISVTGNDEDAILIENQLIQEGISSKTIVKDKTRCTTIKTRVLANHHQLIRLDREVLNPINSDTESKVLNLFKSMINDCRIVLLSDYNKGLLTENLLNNIFDICRKNGIKTIIDPKDTNFAKYRGVNIIKPNKKEAIAATGIAITNRESLEKACIKIKALTNCDEVVVTMSEEGIALYADDQLTIIPTKAIDVVDVTGAGDTVLASLGLSLASGNSLYEACDFANHAAAVVVSKLGSSIATLEEINEKFLS